MNVKLKMAQIDWKKNPVDYVTRPNPSKLEPVTTMLALAPAVKESLKKLDAIGFNITTLPQAQKIVRHLADPSILAALADISPEEYTEVYTKHIRGTPPPSAPTPPAAPPTVGDAVQGVMARSSMRRLAQSEQVELIRLLMDAGFRMDDPVRAGMILSELGNSNAPSAPMAQQMIPLTQNPAQYAQMMNEAAVGAQYNNPPEWSQPSSIPGAPPYTTTVEKQIMPGEIKTPQEMAQEQQDPDYQRSLREQQEYVAPTAPGAPPPAPAPTPAPAPGAPPAIPPAAPAAPAPLAAPPANQVPSVPAVGINWQPGAGGAQGKSKALAEFSSNYAKMSQGLPAGIQALAQGDATGVPIYPEDRSKFIPNQICKAGEMVRSYTNQEDAIVIGKSPDGRLAVRTFPNGVFDLWEPVAKQVRKSMLKLPKSDY